MQTPWGECAVSDAHVHFFSRRFFESLAAQAGRAPEEIAASLGWELPPSDPGELGARWVKELDTHGVERAAIIASMPGDEESVTAASGRWPDRLLAYAMVNPLAEKAPTLAGLH